jgi:hypothetical protein
MIKKIYQIGVNDNKFWHKERLIMFLHKCMYEQCIIELRVAPEASSCRANGVFKQLDTFCEGTGYPKSNISIRTGNMIEYHDEYKIIKDVSDTWFEVPVINDWLPSQTIDTGKNPQLHFGHFIGKSNWNRLWVAAILDSKHKDKSFQTFHSGLDTNYLMKRDDLVDFVGLEDLVQHRCDILPEVISFLQTCPRVIPEDVEFIKNCAHTTYIRQEHYYPIQLPANLNILQFYNNIFVDIVHETFVRDDVFFGTEKSWRPILARRPFITMGARNHLANLKKLGFKTFNDIWDEGYDEYTMQHRVKEIEKLLEHISHWSQPKLIQVLEQMQPILDHNYEVFTQLTHQKIMKIFDV